MRMARRRVGGMVAGLLAAFMCLTTARAGIAPESTILVVNEASWASRTVAGAYAELRRVPASNIVLLRGVSSVDRISVGRFRDEVLGPVLKAIEERGLRGRIDCVVYSVDLPWVVDVGEDLPIGQRSGEAASITGLTYLHERVMLRDAQYLRHDANRYYRAVIGTVAGKELDFGEYVVYRQAAADRRAGRTQAAVDKLRELLKTPRRDPAVAYLLACCLGAVGDAEGAFAALRDAAAVGWRAVGQAEAEPDLKSVRDLAAYKPFAEALAEGPINVALPIAFSSRTAWGPGGEAGGSGGGESYLLSTMLGVTGGRGSSVDEVVGSVRRAASADWSRPAGTMFLGAGETPEAKLRSWAFTALAEKIQKESVRAAKMFAPAPQSGMRIAGAVLGAPELNWAKSESTILAGAIVDNLSADGGVLFRGAPGVKGGPCTDLLRLGAAGTSGLVAGELDPACFATGFLQYFYARGYTLAEAYYQSVWGPARLLILGDAMCAPWVPEIRVQIMELEPGAEVQRELTLHPFEKGGYDVARQYAYIDGQFVADAAAADELKLDLSAFGDGERMLSVVWVTRSQVEARTRHDLPVRLVARKSRVEVSAPPKEVVWGEKLRFTMKSATADWVGVTHLGRLVGVAACRNGEGVVSIDTSQLGLGDVLLRPIAGKGAVGEIDPRPDTLERGATVGAPVRVSVAAPKLKPLPPALKSAGELEPGLLLSVRGEAPRMITDCTSPDWAASMKPRRNFELVGYFRTDAEQTYQVQLRTGEAVELEIDGTRVLSGRPDGAGGGGGVGGGGGGVGTWRFAPVRLPAGEHRVRIFGQVKKDPKIEVRLGVAGTAGLSSEWISAPAPADTGVKK